MASIGDGLTVLEMGSGSAAGSLVGMMLADLGARVIKLEPTGGDPLRTEHPAAFLVWNRGKESVVADLRTDAGRERAAGLAARSDVVIDGFGTGVAASWGLGYDDLEKANPGLVYCSIKGFGSKGRHARLKGYDAVVMAKMGVFSRGLFGFREGPIFSGALLASSGAAHMGFGGLMAALVMREQTGQGQRVEASLAMGLTAIDYFGVITQQFAMRRALDSPGPLAGGSGNVVVSRYAVMPCTKDGRWLVFSPQLPHQARALMRATNLEHLLDEPRFARASTFDSADDAQAWENAIWEAISQKTLDEWLPILLSEPDLPFEVAYSSEEALSHPQLVATGHVVTVEDPQVGSIRQVGPIGNFEKTPASITRSAPALGAHGADPSGPRSIDRSDQAGRYPLAGKTIVELGYFYAMPYAVTLAAELGARVIKLESLEGDPMRSAFGPDLGVGKTAEGKECVAVDLGSPEGLEIALQLLDQADVFVIGFRPGVAERLGLDYETLSKRNPRLVFVHASAYGITGPLAARPLYASGAQAMAGNHHRQAGEWMNPERYAGLGVEGLQAVVAPRLRGLTDGDANAAIVVFSALMAGLYHQERTGEGQRVATSMINGNVYSYADDAVLYDGKPPTPQADEDQLGLSALYRLYETAEGWIFLAAARPSEWLGLVQALESAGLADDPSFATSEHRRANDDALAARIAQALSARGAAEWEGVLTEAGVGCAAVGEGGQSLFVIRDEGMSEAGWVAEADHPRYGRVKQAAGPAQFSRAELRVAPPSVLGGATHAVLSELGYSDADIERLVAARVVALAAD